MTSSNQSLPSPTFSQPHTPYARPLSGFYPTEGPDIIPRASPTISRPRSYFGDPFSLPSSAYTQSRTHSQTQLSLSPQMSNESRRSTNASTTALDSLRTLSSALEASRIRDDHSPSDNEPSPSSSPISRSSSGVWSYMKFGSSATSTSSSSTARPLVSRSYSQTSSAGTYSSHASKTPSNHTSQGPSNYTVAYGGNRRGSGAGVGKLSSTGGSAMYASTTASNTSYNSGLTDPYSLGQGLGLGLPRGSGMDRPLPPRSGGFAHRPKSVDLVTPFSGPGYDC